MMTNTSTAGPLTTADNATAGWAAGELASLIRHVGPGTAAAMVLRQAQRELQSLTTAPVRAKAA